MAVLPGPGYAFRPGQQKIRPKSEKVKPVLLHIIIKQGIYQYDPNETEHKVNNIEQAVTVL